MNRILVSLGLIFLCFSGCEKSNNPVIRQVPFLLTFHQEKRGRMHGVRQYPIQQGISLIRKPIHSKYELLHP